jgi:Helix-hairpin-helix motif
MKLLALLLIIQLYPNPQRLNLNTTSKASLIRLEGVTPEIADAIIKGRPYKSVLELKERKILSDEVFEKIKTKFIVVSLAPFEAKPKEGAEAPASPTK